MDAEATRDRAANCPAHADLVAFNRGKLAVDRMESIGVHVEGCPSCDTALRSLTDESDPLIASLRDSTDKVRLLDEPGCQRLEARARALPDGDRSGPPPRLGQYQLLRRLKGGGMGDVYEALHTRLNRKVALKTLRADRVNDPQLLMRFNREMAAVGKLDHPNIVRASDANEAAGWHFLVMDFVDGLDLAAVVRLAGPLPVADAAAVTRQAALGLQCVHQHGLVHRDIKPSNLMLTPRGEVKILDLGLALLHEGRPAGDEETESGLGLGTADYMSPEQAVDSHQVTIRSDLYSLGCTLYKLLAGKAPFETPAHRSTLKKMQAHVQEAVPPLTSHRAEVPAALTAIVDRLLNKDPAQRFSTPQDVATALEPFAAGSNLPGLMETLWQRDTMIDRPADVAWQAPPPMPGRSPSQVWLARALLTTLVVLVGCAAVLAVVFRPWQGKPDIELPGKHGPAPAIAWPNDFPEALRDRPWGKKIELVYQGNPQDGPRDPAQGIVTLDEKAKGARLRFQPLWFRRQAGGGQFFSVPLALVLNSNLNEPAAQYTALALDDDLAMRWFELEVEIWPSQGPAPLPRAGVFFGWRPLGNERIGTYVIQVDDNGVPDAQAAKNGDAGRALIAHLELPVAMPGQPASDEPFEAMPAKIVAPAIPLGKHRQRYHLKVRAVRDSVTVTVDDEPPVTFVPGFETRGSLGVWVRRGSHWFGHATVKAIPP